jgi:ATP-dependent Lon protease
MAMIRNVLDELDPQPWHKLDRCYVHNFRQPDQPRLITLNAGKARIFKRRMKETAEFIDTGLADALNAAPLKAHREVLTQSAQQKINEITSPLESELSAAGMAMVRLQTGPVNQTAIFPIVNGEPVAPEQYAQMHQAGDVSEADFKQVMEKLATYTKQMQEVSGKAGAAYRDGLHEINQFNSESAKGILKDLTDDLRSFLECPAADEFLDEVVEDVVENRLTTPLEEMPSAAVLYGVNIVSCHEDKDGCPVVVENMPTVGNLFGTIEPEWIGGNAVSNYRGIRAGALVHADGGYLVLDANDVLTEPAAWRLLMRALRTERVDIVPTDAGWPGSSRSLSPQPIRISLRVILIGSSSLYYQLDSIDQDFSNLFKVLADFNSEIDRNEEGILHYAGVLARLVRDEGLLPFDRSAVAALAEHGARVASRKRKITARFGRIADIAREASYLGNKDNASLVSRTHIENTVRRTKYRASLPSQRFGELINDGTIWVPSDGEQVGQINGLAVINAGPLSYGFPARITATIGAGHAGVINIEDRAAMSGAIHTKGFHILEGLMRYLLKTDHPLAFSASIAFEQSYGGIDGDSASGAETCCLLSALTGIPIKQSFAMTGAIDQHGRIQAIGGVNEKIEGFFDICNAIGLSGGQGVIIPGANAGDLMLRPDVVTACDEGRFSVYSVDRIHEALEILMGVPAGVPDEKGDYPVGSLLAIARQRAEDFWKKTLVRPGTLESTRNNGDSGHGST